MEEVVKIGYNILNREPCTFHPTIPCEFEGPCEECNYSFRLPCDLVACERPTVSCKDCELNINYGRK